MLTKQDGPVLVNWLNMVEDDHITNDTTEKRTDVDAVVLFNNFWNGKDGQLVVGMLAALNARSLLTWIMRRYSRIKNFKHYPALFKIARDCRNAEMANLIFSAIPADKRHL